MYAARHQDPHTDLVFTTWFTVIWQLFYLPACLICLLHLVGKLKLITVYRCILRCIILCSWPVLPHNVSVTRRSVVHGCGKYRSIEKYQTHLILSTHLVGLLVRPNPVSNWDRHHKVLAVFRTWCGQGTSNLSIASTTTHSQTGAKLCIFGVIPSISRNVKETVEWQRLHYGSIAP